MGLRLCASCNRHVRESLCPFCGDTESVPLPVPHSRATRAAMVFGTATMVTAIACGGTVETADSGAAPNPSPTETAAPVYGAPVDASPPPVDASRPDASPADASPPKDAAPDSPIAPAYGGPPPDAAVPPYGAPPPRDGGP
ncbi:MAG: hypothetical protein IPF92_18555 [Myxococcales bacterium]|nr:hypothetical protein [Myxococcales bacterium]MBL0197201.1 hypothetical protein [Myxococcales bacterium]HQY63724.1 hypothetical protein [Polyangiaceae bacterium]